MIGTFILFGIFCLLLAIVIILGRINQKDMIKKQRAHLACGESCEDYSIDCYECIRKTEEIRLKNS